MASIAIYNFNKGVGQSSMAANLGWCSAAIAGQTTCVWDMDQAGGASQLLGIDRQIVGQTSQPTPTLTNNLDCLIQEAGPGRHGNVARQAKSLSKQYDRIIVDCPKVLTKGHAKVLRQCDLVIVPITPTPMARRTLERAVRQLRSPKKAHPPVLPVFSQIDMRSRLHRSVAEANPNWPSIPFAREINECATRQQPVSSFAPRAPAAIAFAQLWSAIEHKLTQA